MQRLRRSHEGKRNMDTGKQSCPWQPAPDPVAANGTTGNDNEMYCKGCRYSLRGQVESRCPECGRVFDFSDSSTFDAVLPGPLKRAHRWTANRRYFVVAGLCTITIGIWWLTADKLPLGLRRIDPRIVSTVNLKGILTTWIIQQNEDKFATPFDKSRAMRDMRGYYSTNSEYFAGRLKSLLGSWTRSGYVFLHLLPLAACLTAIAVFWKRWPRRTCVLLLIVVLLFVGDAVMSNFVVRTLMPGSQAFLDDYVYLADVDLMAGVQRGNTIAAYERKLWPVSGRRVVGFADGHVDRMWDEQLIELLKSQGHEMEANALRENKQ